MPDNRDLLAAVEAWARANYPGCPLELVTITLRFLPAPVQLPAYPGVQATVPAPLPAAYEPTDYQAAILAALEYRALRTDALAAELAKMNENGDRSRLFKAGGIKELVQHGLIASDRRLGYYRPDMPPEELVNG